MLLKSRTTLVVAIALLCTSLAYGHVTVQPKQSTAGKIESYILRVPTEKPVPTVRVEVQFPAAIEIIEFESKTGWKIDLQKGSDGRIVSATLTGLIPPNESAQFNFTARNANSEGKSAFKAVQIYQDDSKVEWTGPEGSRTPAPVIELKK